MTLSPHHLITKSPYHHIIIRPDGGIGRHAGLKILCFSRRAGSSPAPGTNPDMFLHRRDFILKTLVAWLPPATCRIA